jgi:two-component system, NtrC family, sensor kinase
MMNRIPWRLALYILLPLGLVISLFGWRIVLTVEKDVEARMTREVEIIGRALQVPVRRAILEGNPSRIQETLDSVFKIGSVHGAFAYDHSGRLLARVGIGGDDPRYRHYILSVLEGKKDTGEYVRFDDIRVYSAFIPVTDVFQNPIGLIQINRDRGQILSSLGGVRLRGIFVALGMILLSALVVMVGHYIAQGRAISRVTGTIERIKQGERDHLVPTSGPREIAALAEALNRMLASLNSAEEEIKERKAVERILREQALRNDRLISLGQLAGGIAHELGAPLSVILGLSRRLKRHYPGKADSKASSWLVRLESEVRRTETIVGQLLDFGSRKQNYEWCEPADVVDMAVHSASADLLRHGSTVEPAFSGDPRKIEAQSMRLSMALRNLLSNAARHAPRTRIDLVMKILEKEAAFIVRDRGEGIPEGMEDRIFEPFISTVQDGHGLGLALVQQVVREHNGIVRARNLGDGAEFRIIIPLEQTRHA